MQVDLRNHEQRHVIFQKPFPQVRLIHINWRVIILVRIDLLVVVPVILGFKDPASVILHDIHIIAVGNDQRRKGSPWSETEFHHRVSARSRLQGACEVEQFADIVVRSQRSI